MRTVVLYLALAAWLLAWAGTLGCSRRSVEMPDSARTQTFDPVRDKPEKFGPGGGRAARGQK
jgi:hypothetical protein